MQDTHGFLTSWQHRRVKGHASSILSHVASWKLTDVSKVLTAPTVRAMICPDDRGSKHLRNVVKFYKTIERNNPGGCHLQTFCRENLTFHNERLLLEI
jgi:hypothetical protein